MEIISVDRVLEPEGRLAPSLNLLLPNEDNYNVLLIQPNAQIEADTTGVRSRDKALADAQFGKFLAEAYETQPDLVVTPEYSMPWQTLVSALKAGKVPKTGKLWALGCESIKFDELKALKIRLAEIATVVFEPLTSQPGRFADPLVYVFLAAPKDGNGPAKTVLLVQFKTSPMSDFGDFEVNNLHRGNQVFQFGKAGESLRLISLICSDVLDFEDAHARAIYDETLIVHIQLNPKPREPKFRAYRDRLLELSGDRTEIICLNWAMNASICCDGQEKQWNNISASAWYLKPDKIDARDETLSANHRRGLYYTWCDPLHSHALFFNFAPATFLVTASKVAHIAIPAVRDRRRGPQLTKTCVWDKETSSWVEQPLAPDGFDGVVGQGGLAKERLQQIANVNPFAVERIVALCAGEIELGQDWYTVRKLESCTISTSEVVRRITFCQDPDKDAAKFRVRRLRRCAELCKILSKPPLPPALEDLEKGFRFEWSPNSPHQNATSATGHRATVMYLSDDSSEADIERVYVTAAENLHKASPSPEQGRRALQRLAVWYLRDQTLIQHEAKRFAQINEAGSNSQVGITRKQ